MLVAQALRSLTRFRRLQPLVGRVHAAVLRRAGGRLRRSFVFAGGQPVLSLTTTGRRTGRPRSTAVAYVRHGAAYAVGGLNLGSDRDPEWALNLRAQPRAWVDVEGRHIAVRAREAIGAEAEQLWAGFIRQLRQVANTRRVADRHVPVFVLEPQQNDASARPDERSTRMTHVQTVQAIYAAFARGDLPAILSRLSEAVVWEYGPTSTNVPWLQRRHGRDGAAAFFATIASEFEMHRFTPKEFLAGDRVVVALIDIELTVRKTGKRIAEEDEIHVWRFDEQGLIVGYRHGIDTHLHQLAWDAASGSGSR